MAWARWVGKWAGVKIAYPGIRAGFNVTEAPLDTHI